MHREDSIVQLLKERGIDLSKLDNVLPECPECLERAKKRIEGHGWILCKQGNLDSLLWVKPRQAYDSWGWNGKLIQEPPYEVVNGCWLVNYSEGTGFSAEHDPRLKLQYVMDAPLTSGDYNDVLDKAESLLLEAVK